VAKGRSWGAANELYAASPLAAANKRVAELTGVLNRVAGLLGVEADVEKLSEWCAKEEKRRRDENER
jgi:hypothetical protein